MQDGNDKLKLLVLLCGEDEDNLQIAAAGGLAMLTGVQKKLCTKLTLVVSTQLFIITDYYFTYYCSALSYCTYVWVECREEFPLMD